MPRPDAGLPDAASADAVPIAASQCASGTEDFAGTTIDWGCWDDTFTHAGTITQADALFLKPSGATTFTTAELATSYAFTGDFDVSVSYALGSDWAGAISSTDNEHLDVALEAFADSTDHIVVARSKASGGVEQVFGYSFGPQPGSQFVAQPYAGTTGKLRLTRIGTALKLRVDTGSGWTDVTTYNFTDEPTHIILGAESVGIARGFTATFDDFTVSGATDFVPYADKPYQPRADLNLGSVPTDYLATRVWGDKWKTTDPLDALAENDLNWARVGVTTLSSSLLASTPRDQWPSLGWHDEFWSSREFAEAILDDAVARGMHLELFPFLSSTAAHAGTQNAPPEWAGLSVDDTATAIEDYTFAVATYYANRGLDIEIYDIGNEIDTGIVNFRPGERIAIPPGTDENCDVHWMRDNVWTIEAKLLSAAIAGVRRANPAAKIVLHTTGHFGICLGIEGPAFFDAMVDLNVDFDFAGLSFYPGLLPLRGGWGMGPALQRAQALIDHVAKLGKKTIVCETAYPHAPADPTLWSEVPGYPFTPSGQAAWMSAMLRFASNDSNIVGFRYFYPEHYVGFAADDTSGPTGLFETESEPEPAMLLVPNP